MTSWLPNAINPWASKSSANEYGNPEAADGSYRPLSKEERLKCWAARDAYNLCLDRHGIRDPRTNPDAEKLCGTEEGGLRADCAKAWVEYFKAKRVADIEKQERLKKIEGEGGRPVQEASRPWWKVW